jgi:hypothetical protein
MDRRFDNRYPSDSIVQITTLPAPGSTCTGKLIDISSSGVALSAPIELPAGSAVQLEVADSFMFGFVVYCAPESSDFRMGIEVQRVLLGGSDLSRLLQSALIDAMPEESEVSARSTPAGSTPARSTKVRS